jgi:hypothetical protein
LAPVEALPGIVDLDGEALFVFRKVAELVQRRIDGKFLLVCGRAAGREAQDEDQRDRPEEISKPHRHDPQPLKKSVM